MQNGWTNPFAAKREEVRWQSCLGELSDEDDSCPDQVVYHEDHLENLFGLYNRVDEAKLGEHLQQKFLGPEGECFKDHLTLAIPSDRETAVWGALKASELSFQKAFRVPENDEEQLWSFSSLNATVEEEQLSRDCSGDEPRNGLENKNIAAVDIQQTEGSDADVRADVNRSEVQFRDGWDHTNADIDDIHDHVVGPSSIKSKSHCFVKPKGTKKKRLNLSFRSMNDVTHAQHGDGQRDECQKLSLAQKLQSLAEPFSLKSVTQAVSKCSNPSTQVPMSVKLLELVQNDSRHNLDKKTSKTSDAPVKTSSKLCIKEDLGGKARMSIGGTSSETINDQFRKALQEAPPVSAEDLNRQGKVQGASSGFAARLQKVLERERNYRTNFLRMLQTRHDSIEGKMSCMDVKIISKSLEARLSACECDILKFPEAYGEDTTGELKVMVIFNMQANSQLELECGTVVRLYAPWQELLVANGSETVKTILCTYFCEVVTSCETK